MMFGYRNSALIAELREETKAALAAVTPGEALTHSSADDSPSTKASGDACDCRTANALGVIIDLIASLCGSDGPDFVPTHCNCAR